VIISKAELNWSFTYRFNSMASDSKGDKVPDVNIMERTPNLRNSSIASPGLKHHQLRVLEALPANT
jgi:hypothetical protein